MNIQLTKNKPITLRIENVIYQYLKPKYLLKENSFKLIEAKVKGSTIIWNLGKFQVSYNQIKKAINNGTC